MTRLLYVYSTVLSRLMKLRTTTVSLKMVAPHSRAKYFTRSLNFPHNAGIEGSDAIS